MSFIVTTEIQFKISIALLIAGLTGCAPEMSFDAPAVDLQPVELEANTNVQALINSYLQSGKEIYTFSELEEIVLQVLVVSSDEGGNFYKRLIVQDSEGSSKRGISLQIDLRSYYTRYPLGSKLYIRAAGLSISEANGSYTLGFRNQERIEAIPEPILDRFLIRSGIQLDLEIPIKEASRLSEEDINTRVRIMGMQFEREDLGKTYGAEPHDAYNALRPLRICNEDAPLFLSTSVFSDFRYELLPEFTFEAEGIIVREYDDQIALVLNSLDDLKIESGSRCDDEFLECAFVDNSESQEPERESRNEILFYEDFEKIESTNDLEDSGWTNLNLNYGRGKFVKRTSSDNTFIRVSAYGTQESTMHTWLISPLIDLNQTRDEYLSFDSRATFNEGRLLSIWISSDTIGDLEAAQWFRLPARISEGSSDGSNEKFISSLEISLGCVNGKIRIAFRYLGGDPGPSTNYDIDNVLITGEPH